MLEYALLVFVPFKYCRYKYLTFIPNSAFESLHMSMSQVEVMWTSRKVDPASAPGTFSNLEMCHDVMKSSVFPVHI